MPDLKIEAHFVEPMLLHCAEKLPEGGLWVYELKIEGFRAEAIKTRTYRRCVLPLDVAKTSATCAFLRPSGPWQVLFQKRRGVRGQLKTQGSQGAGVVLDASVGRTHWRRGGPAKTRAVTRGALGSSRRPCGVANGSNASTVIGLVTRGVPYEDRAHGRKYFSLCGVGKRADHRQ